MIKENSYLRVSDDDNFISLHETFGGDFMVKTEKESLKLNDYQLHSLYKMCKRMLEYVGETLEE